MNAIGWVKFFLMCLFFCRCGWADCMQGRVLSNEGKRYYAKEQYLLASIQFKLASQFPCTVDEKSQALFSYLLSMKQLGEKEEVLVTLQDLERSPTSEMETKLSLFKKIELDIPVDEKLTADQHRRVGLWAARDLHFEDEKTPWVAGTLSAILPGAGQAYVGAWSSAMYSFVLNSLFFATTLEFQREGFYAASLASGLVFSVTYVGGILSSNQAARLYNKSRLEPVEKEKFRELFPELMP